MSVKQAPLNIPCQAIQINLTFTELFVHICSAWFLHAMLFLPACENRFFLGNKYFNIWMLSNELSILSIELECITLLVQNFDGDFKVQPRLILRR